MADCCSSECALGDLNLNSFFVKNRKFENLANGLLERLKHFRNGKKTANLRKNDKINTKHQPFICFSTVGHGSGSFLSPLAGLKLNEGGFPW